MKIPDYNLNRIDEFKNFNLGSLEREYELTVGGETSFFNVDGFYSVNIVNGVPEYCVESIEVIRESFNPNKRFSPFINTNREYSNTSYRIKIKNPLKKPLLINNYYTRSGGFTPSNITIEVSENSVIDILELNHSSKDNFGLCNREFNIEGSVVNYTRLDLISRETNLVYNYYGDINKGTLNGITINNRGESSLNIWDIDLLKENSLCSINGVVSIGESMIHGTICKLNHRAKGTTSSQEFRHVLEDSSYAMYDGDSYMEGVATDSSSSQESKTILLSNKARILNKPRLNIYTGEVKATHGATVGKLNQDAVFYLKQRGIPEKRVKEILVEGFVKDILDRIPSKRIREVVYDKG